MLQGQEKFAQVKKIVVGTLLGVLVAGCADPIPSITPQSPITPPSHPETQPDDSQTLEGRSGKPESEPIIGEETWRSLLEQSVQRNEKSIRLENWAVSARHLEFLSSADGLLELMLDQGMVDDEGMAIIAQNCPKLEHLRLRLSPLSDRAGDYLAKLRNLRILNLPQARLTSQGLRSLRTLGQLEQVRLGGAQLDDDCVAILASLPRLESLHLIGPTLTDKSLEYLAEAPVLNAFYLDKCPMSEQAWKRLGQRRPELHIHLDQPHRDW